MGTISDQLIAWIGWLLYGLGFLALWVYSREQNRNEKRITKLEETRPTHDDITTMIKAALYEDSRP